jgi:hypothetical protein
MSNQDDQKKKGGSGGGAPHISDMILGSLKPRTGKETSKWIAGLADESVEDAVAAAAAQHVEEPAPLPPPVASAQKHDSKHDMTHLLDHLFDCFQQYEYEFNRTVHGTDLMVQIDRPQIAMETIKQKFQPSETVQVFRGRISTRQWTLLIRGRDQMVEGWIMPIDKLISFTGDPGSFIRFLFIEAVWLNGDLQWRIDGVEVPWEHVRSLAKQLFGALVKVARGEASDQTPFSLRPKQAVDRSYEQLAAITPEQAQQQQRAYSFEEHNPNFDSPFASGQRPAANPEQRPREQVQSGRPPSVAPNVGPSSQMRKDQTAQTQPIQVAQQQYEAQQYESQQLRQQQQNQQLPPQQSAQLPVVQQMPPVQQQSQSPMPIPMQMSNAPSMDAILEMLNQSVSAELEKLSRAGSEAFARQDLVTVESAMRRAARIKELQAEIARQVDQWKLKLRDA